MDSPEKIAEQRLAASRNEYLERLINLENQKSEETQPITYLGYDVEFGQAIVSHGENTYRKNVATNGLIVSERTIMSFGEGITSMPNIKPTVATTSQSISKIEFIICVILSYPHTGSEDKSNDKFEFYVQAGKNNRFKKVHEILEVDFSQSANGAFFYDEILYNYSNADIDLVLSNLRSPYQFELLYPSKIGEVTYIKNNNSQTITRPPYIRNSSPANYFLGNVVSPRLNSANWGNLYDDILGNYYLRETILDTASPYNKITYIYPDSNIIEDTESTSFIEIVNDYYYWDFKPGFVYPYPQYEVQIRNASSYQGNHKLLILPDLEIENSINVTVTIDGEMREYDGDGFSIVAVPTVWV
jgi:hypothetical protein